MAMTIAKTEIDQEHTPLPIEEQPNAFEEAIREQSESKLYTCIEWLADLKRHVPLQYHLKKMQIKTALGDTALNLRDFGAIVSAEVRRQEQAERSQKPDIAHVAIKWALNHHDEWGYNIATHTWYQWSGTHWQALYEEASKPSPLDQEAIDALATADIAVNSNQALNCFRRVAANYCKRPFQEEHAEVINFANGTLTIHTLHMKPHTQEDNLTYCLNYYFTPSGHHPNIDATLEETIPDLHARQAMIAHIGLSLIRDTSFHNFALLIGPPRAGKSTVLALMNAVCGLIDDPWKFAGPSLFSRDLEGKRSRAMWVEQRGVCVDELPGEALRDEELLKLMSAHGGVEMRRIGKDERTDNRWKPKLLMSTNDTPHYKDTSGAIRQRAIIISCPNGPRPEDQQDKNLVPDKLIPEIGAFAATCLQYALAIKRHGYYPRSGTMKKLLDEIEHNDPLKAFVRECCVIEPKNGNTKITSDQLHKAYAEYVSEGGNSPMAKNKVSSSIRDMHIGVSSGEWMRYSGRPCRCLKGIRLRGEHDGDPAEPSYQDDPLLFSPYPPAPGSESKQPQDQTQVQTTQENIEITSRNNSANLDYPACLAEHMEPPPEEPCSTCEEKNYAPYWGKFATLKWGCATCYPEIPKQIGGYDPDRHQ